MSTDKTGGSAFPHTAGENTFNNQSPIPDKDGMTLLDYVATSVLQGYWAHKGYCNYEQAAEQAYKQAHAMLEERKKYMQE